MSFDSMMMRSISLVFVLSFLAAPAQAQDPAAHGQALVAEFCGGCHAVGVKGKSKHPDAPPFRTLGRTVDLDEFPVCWSAASPEVIPICRSSNSVTTTRSPRAPICA